VVRRDAASGSAGDAMSIKSLFTEDEIKMLQAAAATLVKLSASGVIRHFARQTEFKQKQEIPVWQAELEFTLDDFIANYDRYIDIVTLLEDEQEIDGKRGAGKADSI
jgi:hypothetical protein